MEDRIQINGIWYRRETGALTEEETVDLDPCWNRTILVENSNLCLEASVSCNDVDNFTISEHSYINIEVTDKRTKPWKTEHWDSEVWLLGVHKRLPESLNELNFGASEYIGPIEGEDRRFAIAFIDYLVEIGWIKE